MKRRFFLGAAMGVIPALGLHDILTSTATAQTAPAPSAGVKILGNGEDRSGSPHQMPMSTMSYKVVSAETSGAVLILEHQHLMPGGPPLHMHLNQDEWFYVLEGQVAFQVGDQRVTLKPGESMLAPRRVPHTFSLVEGAPGRMMIAFTPAGKMEQFFHDSAALHSPRMSDPAFWRQYEMELLGPSPFAKA